MKNQTQPLSVSDASSIPLLKRVLILSQFFLIIFVYHILKDLKDSLVITSSDAGAEIIPFIKIWVILPFAFLASYAFSKLYQRFGREKAFYFFVTFLLCAYALFAFCFYPFRDALKLSQLADILTMVLPAGCKGFVAMVGNWIYTFFYLNAELWSMMILTVFFWGYLNETTSLEQAKYFYPLCVLTGNCAGILAGQSSGFLCRTLTHYLSWQETMQWMILAVIACGILVMVIHRKLHLLFSLPAGQAKKIKETVSFKDSLQSIVYSRPLLCIALLVIGFGLTSNLIEVVWKESIKRVYPLPQDYTAYVNQLTSIIGILSLVMSLIARRIFQIFSWSQVAMITPVLLLVTSSIFFFSLQMPTSQLAPWAAFLDMHPFYLVMTIGSFYYVFALTAKYTIFDMCKEMAFLSIASEERMRAKSVIDSVGSRLGKSGASCLYQFLLVVFGSTAGHIPVIGCTAIVMIAVSMVATKKLAAFLGKSREEPVILLEKASSVS